ncbi:MAG: zinc ABC transporter substrate-binding protein [Tannerellaceae bacterium]|jgi:zinc transport system substrate-binding protein|nr:zinc ABC transporter substrate-binding protein [Tannerellaceae bacterium]
MKRFCFFLTLIPLLALPDCTAPKEGNYVAVTIETQRYFAEKIAGDKFTIHTVVPTGQSPEIYDPTPQQMVRVSKSLAYLQIGLLGFEQAWIPQIQDQNPRMQLFDLSEGFTLIKEEEDDDHDHDGERHHHHPGGVDPHIWSSIGGARAIAANTLKAFIALDKDNETYYRQNYNLLTNVIDETEQIIRQKLSTLRSRAFIIYHPSLTYFADEFELIQLCIETDGKEPSPAQLKELVDQAKTYRANVIFVQQEFDSKNAQRIAEETGCRLVTIHPQNYNWSDELISIANALADEQ